MSSGSSSRSARTCSTGLSSYSVPWSAAVRLVHVSLVVLVVVQVHRLLVDVRLERRVVVRQRRNLEWHTSSSFLSTRTEATAFRACGARLCSRASGNERSRRGDARLQPRGDHPRQLKPELLELDGISRETHRGALQALPGLREQAERDPREARRRSISARANQVYSELRALKVELSFAIGGIKNHEISLRASRRRRRRSGRR